MDLAESRYDRAERITWWDQERLRNSRVLVVGAGALGNEVIKNLVLVGVGNLFVCDMDEIEHSNLSRCVFFKDGDEGSSKSELLAKRAAELNPEVKISAFVGPVQALGAGFLSDFDIVVGALDNREARLWVSRASRMAGLRFVDAAIEGLHALVRVFPPQGTCYACTLSEVDWQSLNARRSCALLSRDDIASGKTPTNASTSSIAAAIQSQEVVKYLVGREDLGALEGKVWHLIGEQMVSYVTILAEDPDCTEHWECSEVKTVGPWETLADVANEIGNASSTIQMMDDLMYIAPCECGMTSEKAGLASLMKSIDAQCQHCQAALSVASSGFLRSDSPAASVAKSRLRWPSCEYVIADVDGKSVAYLVKGD